MKKFMIKFVGMLVVLGAAFGLGYFVGQLPISEKNSTIDNLKSRLANLSRNVVDTTFGIPGNLRSRQGLLDAKSRLIQAKSDLLDRNYGNAAKELAEAADSLDKAGQAERDSGRTATFKALAGKSREAKLELTMGKTLPRARLDEIQKEVDGYLAL
ncbi:MAG: hypothetical protein ACREI2_07555 [Nitrospiraceae bacterium]